MSALGLLVIASFTLGAHPALANSLASTSPAVGSVLQTAPNAVSVTATGSLLDQGNTLTVTDPTGTEVDDGSLTISDTTAVVGLKPLTATGIYTVSYSLLSATDAPLTGSFTFLFNAPSTITTSSPSPTPISNAPTAAPTKSNTGSSAANIAVIILFIVATLVGLFLVWYARMIWSESRTHKSQKSKKRSPKKASE